MFRTLGSFQRVSELESLITEDHSESLWRLIFDVLTCITIAVPTPNFSQSPNFEKLNLLFLQCFTLQKPICQGSQSQVKHCFRYFTSTTIGSDFPNCHHLRFYSLGVTATLKNQGFCTNLISNTHKASHESRPCMLPALHFKDAMLKTVLSASQVIQSCLNVQIAYLLNLLCVPCSAPRSSKKLGALIQFTNRQSR